MSRKKTAEIQSTATQSVPSDVLLRTNIPRAKESAPGSIGARVAALETLCATVEACRCESCFHLAMAARERIASLTSWG